VKNLRSCGATLGEAPRFPFVGIDLFLQRRASLYEVSSGKIESFRQ